MTAMFTSCNDDSVDDTAELVYSSTQVKSFKLKADNKVLSGLDSVFFSIDLVKAEIFNADSLPLGTRTNKLVLSITTDVCSKIELNVPRKNGTDTIINYLTNSTDSIDFSNGPVRLHLVSYDGQAERDYVIKVNVHKMEPDSLYWNKTAMRPLPTDISNPTAQKTVRYGDNVVTLATDGNRYTFGITDNPYSGEWTVTEANFKFIIDPDVSSFAASDNALYILDNAGHLYMSADGVDWGYVGEQWLAVYGGYRNKVLGLKEVDGVNKLVTYPGGQEIAAPRDFPVSGTSRLCELTTKWTDRPQSVMLGGRTADGELTNAVWGYDGSNWAKVSTKFPKGVTGATMFEYRVALTDTLSWQSKELPVLIAMGGEDKDGLNRKVYLSRNSGMDWKEGDELLQLPDYIAPRRDAQAIVVNTTATVSRAASSRWIEYQAKSLPRWWSVDIPAVSSRAVAPVTQWEVPYIYLFGGYDAQGNLYDSVWRGVINRLTFKPLQ